MKSNEKKMGIVLLDMDGLDYFDLSQKKVFPFNFSLKLISDLEIINRNELETQMFLFINYYKIQPVPLIILLTADVCFELPITESNETNFENIVNNFLVSIPFEETAHKIYKQPKGYLLVAANKDLIDIFKYIFTKMGFTMEAVVPSSIVGINVKTIDAAAAEFIMAKFNQLKDQSLISAEVRVREKKVEEKNIGGVKRVFLLISLFLILLSFLLYLLYLQSSSSKKTPPQSNRKLSYHSANIT
ncbi:hypothetical protein A2W14_03315 [Candidatus Gottesmanbacteria bacterium RBG_16_37_8]|uniref:Uncharacterized protein n=1 Tax=Candidatus Gottesmanbacteria bacterium RBG_16_37_8 TaxID=1798371 RepID=A0A1F5YTP7_9BACT|nr:MAG: hypothetical protein A2W14_03315 [Candidatus Gottesmanbacteria bacterium RBG_16_37_8]